MENRHMRLKTAAVKLVGAIFILLLLVISLYPFIWMILNSFKENMEIFKQPFLYRPIGILPFSARPGSLGSFQIPFGYLLS